MRLRKGLLLGEEPSMEVLRHTPQAALYPEDRDDLRGFADPTGKVASGSLDALEPAKTVFPPGNFTGRLASPKRPLGLCSIGFGLPCGAKPSTSLAGRVEGKSR